MKSVKFELIQKNDQVNNEFVSELKRQEFTIIHDSLDKFEHLRFVTVDMKFCTIDLNGISVSISNLSRPYLSTNIYAKFLHQVDIEF